MKDYSRSCIHFLALGALLLSEMAAPAFAQAQKPGSKDPFQPKPGAVTQTGPAIKRFTRPAKTFQAFPMLDRQKKPVPAGAMLDLPDGRRVRAGDYYAELNKFEKELCAQGFSLRDPDVEARLGEVVVDRNKLSGQLQKVRTAHRLLPQGAQTAPMTLAAQTALFNASKKEFAQTKRIEDAVTRLGHKVIKSTNGGLTIAGPATTGLKTSPLDYSTSATESFGWTDTVYAYYDLGARIHGDIGKLDLESHAKAGGKVFGMGGDLILAEFDQHTSLDGVGKIQIHVNVLGNSLFNVDQSQTFQWSKSDSQSASIGFSQSIPIPIIGPFTVNVTLGVKGSAGCSYMATATPISLNARITPFVHSNAYATAELNLYAVKLGAGGELTLINDDMTLAGDLRLDTSTNSPVISACLSAEEKLTALSGRVYAYAKVFKFWDWEWKTYSTDIFATKGITANGYLFNECLKKNLIQDFNVANGKAN